MRIRFIGVVFIGAIGLVRGIAAADAVGSGLAVADLQTQALRCEYLNNPIGMDEPRPRLSWTLASSKRGVVQSAYEVQVATTQELLELGRADVWDSGKVVSTEQNQVEYTGRPLSSMQGCFWRVRAWNGADEAGPWSDAASWEVGLREASDWKSQWISGGGIAPSKAIHIEQAVYETDDGKTGRDVTAIVAGLVQDGRLNTTVTNANLGGDPAEDHKKRLRLRYCLGGGPGMEELFAENTSVDLQPQPLQVLRHAFHVEHLIVRARLYATALGLYEFEINGRRVGDHVFAPDWTDYRKRVRYQAYDVTSLVKVGDNAIAGTVADGWYSGHIGNGGFQFWGKVPCVRAQLELTFDDGSVQRVCTDESWRSHEGPILASDMLNGEDYDARAAFPASDAAVVEDGNWMPVKVRTDGLPPEIDAQVAPPVRELMTLHAQTLSEPTRGHWVFDLGQNMVGVPRLSVTAPAGSKLTFRFAEMLNPDGTIYTANYRGAKSIDTYVCRGGAVEVWQPRFTFHGFRYVELTGLTSKPPLDAVTGVVLGSDTPSVGSFDSSDPRINQLWSNIRWGQRGNFLSVPTDCPQRDERLGWMGDAQVFIGTAVYNADVSAFFNKWLVDVDDEQTADGQYTNTSPEPVPSEHGSPAWADAGVICPWTIYRTYGDRRELARHLPNMERWVDSCKLHSDGLIRDRDRGSDFGDWLSIGADTSKELLGTAYFAHVTDLVARSARVLKNRDAAKYTELFKQIKDAFNAKYVTPDGRVAGDTQTGYALALAFELLPEDLRRAAAEHLAENVRSKGNHLSTGFVGVSYLLPALANRGHLDAAYDLLMQDTFPSWLFSVKHGATTIWERWDGWTPDKGFQDPGMNSFNHYSLGSCGQWLYEGVAGIQQPADGAGFDRVVIRPHPGGGLTQAAAEYESIRGKIRSAWKLADHRLTLEVTIPPNVSAEVHVPTDGPETVKELGGAVADGRAEVGGVVIELGSGQYVFTALETGK